MTYTMSLIIGISSRAGRFRLCLKENEKQGRGRYKHRALCREVGLLRVLHEEESHGPFSGAGSCWVGSGPYLLSQVALLG